MMRAVRAFLLGLPLVWACGGSGGGDRLSYNRAGAAAGGSSGAAGSSSADGSIATVTVDPATLHQPLEGFGAAVAYYSERLAARGKEGDDLYDVLFRDLGLDILRIGNWYQNQSDDATEATELGDRAISTILEKATASLGHRPKILMSSWSPPAYLKDTGQVQTTPGTLKQENGSYVYDKFGAWWVAALEAYAAREIRPDYVSIQNEPDFFNKGWATCLLDPKEGGAEGHAGYGPALDAVYKAVQEASSITPKPQFIGGEPAGIASNKVQDYLAGLVNPAQISIIGHHLYNGGSGHQPDGYRSAMRALAKTASSLGKPLFMTEYSLTDGDAGLLYKTAWLIHNSLVEEGVSAYVYWDLFWVPPSNDPLVLLTGTADSPDKGYTILDSYYALKHFARWTDPGWTRVEATSSQDDIRASAFASPSGDALTVVLVNTGFLAQSVTVAPAGADYAHVEVYRSSGTNERTASVELGEGNTLEMPDQSIATIAWTR